MSPDDLQALLEEVRDRRLGVAEALSRLRHFPTRDLGHTRLDTQRALRCGHPEVVYGAGKTVEQLIEIARAAVEQHGRLLITRTPPQAAARLVESIPGARLHAASHCVTVGAEPEAGGRGLVLVVSAGTSDLPIAEEAAVTARALGARTEELIDVGVAGLHRLLAHLERLRAADALVVVAGMEGALPSVVGGLVERPVIAVPTSVGYGASLGGLAALLAMLNSCAAGVTVVNIDNGFGAGVAAARIVDLAEARTRARTT